MTLRKPIFKPYFVWGEPLMMASLLSPAVAPFPHYSKPSIDFFKTPTSLPHKRNSIKCDSFLDNISQSLLNDSLHLDRFTAFQQLQSAAGELPEVQKWVILFFSGLAWIYLTARPGVLIGAIDAYIFATLQLGLDSLLGRRNLKRSDFLHRLGEGSFGVVYSGLIVPKNVNVDQSVTKRASAKAVQRRQGLKDKVILKKIRIGVQGAVECGDYEEWFNYRMSRAAPDTCAEFLGSFVSDTTDTLYTKGEKWLVWKFEGDLDLADYMKGRGFPLNLESVVFARKLQGLEPNERNALIIKQVMRQIISSLKKIHDTGIVHRDVKPSNLVVTKKGRIKLIDFGAATDLRIAKNYVPDRGLLDPDYCPPELYVMPEETPKPPPEPIAALVSPILWQLNSLMYLTCTRLA